MKVMTRQKSRLTLEPKENHLGRKPLPQQEDETSSLTVFEALLHSESTPIDTANGGVTEVQTPLQPLPEIASESSRVSIVECEPSSLTIFDYLTEQPTQTEQQQVSYELTDLQPEPEVVVDVVELEAEPESEETRTEIKAASAPRGVVFIRAIVELLIDVLRRMMSLVKVARVSKRLRVCETVSLGDKRVIALLQIDGESFVVGAAPNSVQLLAWTGSGSTQQFKDILHQANLTDGGKQ